MIKDKQELHQIQHLKQLNRSVKISAPLDLRDFMEFDETEIQGASIEIGQRSPRSCQSIKQLVTVNEEHSWEILDSKEMSEAFEKYQAKSAEEAIDLAYIKMYISNLKADYFTGR